MLLRSTAICCPRLSFTFTRGKPLQLSGPWSERAWFSSSRLPMRWANKPKDPRSCSQFLISQWREQRFIWLRSSSRRKFRSSRRPVDLSIQSLYDIQSLSYLWQMLYSLLGTSNLKIMLERHEQIKPIYLQRECWALFFFQSYFNTIHLLPVINSFRKEHHNNSVFFTFPICYLPIFAFDLKQSRHVSSGSTPWHMHAWK